MDDPQFSFLTTPKVCDDPPDMLVMVLTAPKNIKERNAIRKGLASFNANSKYGKIARHNVLKYYKPPAWISRLQNNPRP